MRCIFPPETVQKELAHVFPRFAHGLPDEIDCSDWKSAILGIYPGTRNKED